jgi:hypothetical protein
MRQRRREATANVSNSPKVHRCERKIATAQINRSALRSTSRFGFAGVPNPLNLELNLLRLFEVALFLASWRGRVVLQSKECSFSTALRAEIPTKVTSQ